MFEMDDLTLWNLIIKGDRKALEVLYQRYYSLLLNYGLKCDIDRETVKDCIQDLFVGIFKNTNIKTTDLTVRSYLLRALRNNLNYKLASWREENSLGDFAFSLPSNEDLFERLFPKNDCDQLLARQLVEVISQLSSNQKRILYLRYVKGFSYKEIADVMNINVQSAKNLHGRGLEKLRRLMNIDNKILDIWLLLIVRVAFDPAWL